MNTTSRTHLSLGWTGSSPREPGSPSPSSLATARRHFRASVLAVEESKLIRWRGRVGVKGVLNGEHDLLLQELADGTTRFTQRGTFRRILVPFRSPLAQDTEAGFARMNAAFAPAPSGPLTQFRDEMGGTVSWTC